MDKRYASFMEADVSPYIGQWVAIVDTGIVASSKSAKQAYAMAKKAYPKRSPLLARVPDKETMIL